MRKKERIAAIIEALEKLYPQAECALNYTHPYELLIATRLSAQCTDERVNKVTPALFKKYPTLEAFANADFDELCAMVHSCGFFRGKAKSIIEMSQMLINEYGGIVPDTIEELCKFNGVGRKTANLVLSTGYNIPAICVDVHVHRISNRLGYVHTKTPEETEMALRNKMPKKYWIDINTLLVTHGQNVCKPIKPMCNKCPISEYCQKII